MAQGPKKKSHTACTAGASYNTDAVGACTNLINFFFKRNAVCVSDGDGMTYAYPTELVGMTYAELTHLKHTMDMPL